MLKFIAEGSGFTQFDRTFNRIEEQIDDFRWVWPSVATEFRAIMADQFTTEGAQGASGKWKPLTPAYAKFKELAYPGMPILQATGHMMESLTDFEAGDSVFRPEKDSLTLGTRTEYAGYHQRGTPRMKARPIISMTENTRRRLQKAIQVKLVEFVRRQGFVVSGGVN